jgi:hypothetical protein
MSAKPNEPYTGGARRFVRAFALAALAAGTVGSIALMLRTSPNMPPLNVVLIGLWVISPFVLLALCDALANRWPLLHRPTIHVLALVLVVVALSVYQSVAFGPPRPKPAALYVLIPPISWLVIATGLGMAALVSRKRRARSV